MPDMAGKVALITGASGKATAVKTDVSAAKDVERMVAHAVDTFGRIDCAVNNAGEARAMLAGGHGGAIVNIGSVNSFLGFGTGSACVASKHGLIGLTTCVSAELAPQGIASYITGTTLTPDGGYALTV